MQDICDAVRERMAQGGIELIELEALANGTYEAPEGKAYSEVTVDVNNPDALTETVGSGDITASFGLE